MSDKPTIFHIDRLDLHFAPKPWDFAVTRRPEIDVYFAELQRQKPEVWNGRVLLLHSQVVRDGVFHGAYLETDFASFTAWRHWGSPHSGVRDCFGAAAIVSADGALLLGVMGAHTVNAGWIYFPCGTPDLSDLAGDTVDLGASVARELKEETGCDIAAFRADPGWITVVDGGRIVQLKLLRSAETAEALRARILAYLATEEQPELADIRIVRSPADFDPAMPRFVTAFLENYFAGG
ncbi:MAG TPA: NUDIX hydrolase [Pseudolabrys sp.]|jgi:8-oxo-dGTP pyrophosphatase MutT (NUDIX family)|nr:NUDIX hydrolase [Pseudolabrys sp.]